MSKVTIGFIQACWHKEIVDSLRDSFTTKINSELPETPHIDVWEVPGSLEIPLQLKHCAENGNYDIFVVAGLIVNGGIYRHEFVASAVLNSVMEIQLATGVPVIYGVLTPHNFHGEEHEKYFLEHFKTKGCEAASACIQTLQNLERMKNQYPPAN